MKEETILLIVNTLITTVIVPLIIYVWKALHTEGLGTRREISRTRLERIKAEQVGGSDPLPQDTDR